MHRCIELARIGATSVAPNPMVGAVLVHQNTIIGEGYHEVYGSHHAEVNCIRSVPEKLLPLIPESTLYVSLEPCSHYGKTPPCADLIIANKIPRVVIGCRDPFVEVNGKGIEKLKAAGIDVVSGVLETECRELNKRFFTFHQLHRPYVILKWAETADGKIGNAGNNRLMITNENTNRLVHKWRSEEMSIMVGTNTAGMDDPRLTNRLWFGKDPVRLVVDLDLRLPSNLHLFDGNAKTIVFNLLRHDEHGRIVYYQVSEDASIVDQVLNGLVSMNITSVMIEGGAKWIQSFIDANSWDEARVITNSRLKIEGGVPSPQLSRERFIKQLSSGDDMVKWYLSEN